MRMKLERGWGKSLEREVKERLRKEHKERLGRQAGTGPAEAAASQESSAGSQRLSGLPSLR